MRAWSVRSAASHVLYLPSELAVAGQDDEAHMVTAASHQAVLVSTNARDFDPLHLRWQTEGREHAGILTTPDVEVGELVGGWTAQPACSRRGGTQPARALVDL